MTPQHRLAIEIMSECGMSPHEIVADENWSERPKLSHVNQIVSPDDNLPSDGRHYLVFAGRKQSIDEPGRAKRGREAPG